MVFGPPPSTSDLRPSRMFARRRAGSSRGGTSSNTKSTDGCWNDLIEMEAKLKAAEGKRRASQNNKTLPRQRCSLCGELQLAGQLSTAGDTVPKPPPKPPHQQASPGCPACASQSQECPVSALARVGLTVRNQSVCCGSALEVASIWADCRFGQSGRFCAAVVQARGFSTPTYLQTSKGKWEHYIADYKGQAGRHIAASLGRQTGRHLSVNSLGVARDEKAALVALVGRHKTNTNIDTRASCLAEAPVIHGVCMPLTTRQTTDLCAPGVQ